MACSDLVMCGAGAPEGSVTGVVGNIYLRSDGGANTTLYVKESGTGNTGWVAVTYVDESAITAAYEAADAVLAAATTALAARVTTAEGDITALEAADVALDARLDTAESDINALEAADTALDGRLDTAETDITALEGADTALDSRLDAVEANNWVTTARITDLNVTTDKIAEDAVTNAKLAEVNTATFKGRTTAGTGNPEDLTATQATALLNTVTTSAKGLVPTAPNLTTQFLRGDASWAVPQRYGIFEFGGGAGLQTIATVLYLTAGSYEQTSTLSNNTSRRVLVPFACELYGAYAVGNPGTGGGTITFSVIKGTPGVGNDATGKDFTVINNNGSATMDWSGAPVSINANQWLVVSFVKSGTITTQITGFALALLYRTT